MMTRNAPVRSTLSARFSTVFQEHLRPGFDVLDLGAGSDGSERSPLASVASRVRRVVAVDTSPMPGKLPPNVEWQQERIEDWLSDRSFFPSDPFHAVVARNSLHFLDRDLVLDALLPSLADSVHPGGILAIATFFRQPDPPADPPYPSLFRLADLRRAFPPRWNALLAVEETLRGPGHGNPAMRDWHTTQLVIRKPL